MNTKNKEEKITNVTVITMVAAIDSQKLRQKLTKPIFITRKNEIESIMGIK
jgi:hypothetical protein